MEKQEIDKILFETNRRNKAIYYFLLLIPLID